MADEGETKVRVKLTKVRKMEEVDIDGEVHTVVELTGKEITKWRNGLANNLKFVGGKPVGVNSTDGIESSLICLCIRDAQGNKITAGVIDEWSASIQKELFDICRRINSMTVEGEEEEKKS